MRDEEFIFWAMMEKLVVHTLILLCILFPQAAWKHLVWLWLSFPALTCKTSNHKQHEKGDCRGEGDLFIFLLEDLKRLSYLSYLGCCWKDTEIIREGTDKESKQLLVAA